MPKINEYNSRVDVAGAANGRKIYAEEIDTGRDMRRLGAGLTDLGEGIQKRVAQSEVSDLTAKMAETKSQYDTYLKETLRTAKPGDPNVAQNFMTKLDEHVAKLGEGLSTREAQLYFNQSSAALKANFAEGAAQGQAELAGAKAKQDYISTFTNLSSGLLNDPSSFELSKNMHDQGLDALVSTGGLPSEVAVKLKTEGQQGLAKNAIQGWINMNPEYAKKQLDDGKWDSYINGDVKQQMYGQVRLAESAQRAEAERMRAEAERIKKEQQMITQNKFLEKMSNNQLSTKEILASDLDPVGSGSKKQFIDMIEQNSKSGGNIKTDPGTYTNLFNRIHLPDGDPNKIINDNDLNKHFGKGLNMESLNQLRKEIQGGRTQEGRVRNQLQKEMLNDAKKRIIIGNGFIKDPEGTAQYQQFVNHYLNEYQAQREKGKTDAELFDPNSPDYLGKNISQFTRSRQDIIKSMARGNSGTPSSVVEGASGVSAQAPNPATKPAVVPRLPGESPADWKKRKEAINNPPPQGTK